ncbi:hypothetical protein SELMODRAFT_421890 [Selaginella moellendorffii]|uniref:DUF4057 domain-containing protein n=2 Tax=Selaginella moellendorffii TaxID=88036 RepID=D8SGN8_SELML|nr:hypothetical protein SELMODRAFT_421890 [Selaginella moellendorffii]
MSAIEKRGSQGKSDLLSWSDGADASSDRATPVRFSATNDSKGFAAANDQSCTDPPVSRSAIRILQPSGGSQISFGEGDNSFQKKASSHAEVAKQRELSGTQETFEEQPRRPMSNAKAKEMCGSNIFGPPTSEYSSQGQRTHNQKAAEMTGNDIFKKGGYGTPVEKSLSDAKRREMIGSDIFSEEKPPPSQQSVSNRIRKPPGGPSTIVLDVVARIKQLRGSNPVQHDENATPEGLNKIPDVYADKHLREAKVKEMSGTHDFYNRGSNNKENNDGTDKMMSNDDNSSTTEKNEATAHRPLTPDMRRSEKHHSNAKRQEIAGNYDLLNFSPSRHDNADYIKYPSERPASSAKLRELSGSYAFGDCFTDQLYEKIP